MDKKIKAKWIKALRSGKYKQGKKALKFRGRYCCLGVLCEVLKIKPELSFGDWSYDAATMTLPESAQKRARIDKYGTLKSPVLFKGNSEMELVGLNDAGADFNFIADVIEKQL